MIWSLFDLHSTSRTTRHHLQNDGQRPDRPSRADFHNHDGLSDLERLYRKKKEAKALKKWLYEELEKMTSLILEIEDPHILMMMIPSLLPTSSTGPSPKTPTPSTTKSSVSAIAKSQWFSIYFFPCQCGSENCVDRIRDHFNFSGPSKDDFLSHIKNAEMCGWVAIHLHERIVEDMYIAASRLRRIKVALITTKSCGKWELLLRRLLIWLRHAKVPKDYENMRWTNLSGRILDSMPTV